jgi:hypothetical protein
MISEEDLAQGNAPEESKQRITQMTKAIRYKARKEGGNLFKAFNDYMGSTSGVSATDRAAVKQRLGLSEKYSTWRDDLREVIDIPPSNSKKDDEMEKPIKEKKVKNKVIINPSMKEAFDKIGGVVIDEQEITPEQKKQLQNKQQMLKKQQMLQKQTIQMQKQGRLPVGHSEGYAPGDVDQKVGAVTSIPKSEQDAARARILAKAKAKREKMKEETEDSLKDKRMERGGVGGNIRYDTAPKQPKMSASEREAQMKKRREASSRAFDAVKKMIQDKHGKGAIMDTKKK